MKMLKFVASSSRVLLNSLLVLFFVSAAIGVGHVSYQEKNKEKKIVFGTESGVAVQTYIELPETTESCTPEESEWWERLRKVGGDLQRKRDDKTKKRFYLLLYEGQQKAYRIPVKDTLPVTLIFGRPTYSLAQKYKITGSVVLSVEYSADASIGDIQVIKGLRLELDENAIRAMRQTVFLPAIKNGAFVTYRGNVETMFVHH